MTFWKGYFILGFIVAITGGCRWLLDRLKLDTDSRSDLHTFPIYIPTGLGNGFMRKGLWMSVLNIDTHKGNSTFQFAGALCVSDDVISDFECFFKILLCILDIVWCLEDKIKFKLWIPFSDRHLSLFFSHGCKIY